MGSRLLAVVGGCSVSACATYYIVAVKECIQKMCRACVLSEHIIYESLFSKILSFL